MGDPGCDVLVLVGVSREEGSQVLERVDVVNGEVTAFNLGAGYLLQLDFVTFDRFVSERPSKFLFRIGEEEDVDSW